MKKTLAIVSSLFVSASAYSAVGIVGGQVGDTFDQSGALIANGAVGVLVADFSNNGILDARNTVLSVNSFIGGGTDDRILGVYTASSGNFDFSGLTFEYTGSFNAGDHLYFLWFPSVTTVGATVGSGVSYGSFRSDVVQAASGADIAWVAPADGNYTLLGITASQGGDPAVTPAALTANLITAGAAIPEPSTAAALAASAILGFAATRRRRA